MEDELGFADCLRWIHKAVSPSVQVQEEKAMAAAPAGPIAAEKLITYVGERKKKKMLLRGEYLLARKSAEEGPQEVGRSKENFEKNQYGEIIPYDRNRVILNLLPGDAHSDYVNASYLDSWYEQQAYILTQGVRTKAATIDLWRLVWESGSTCLVMLTKVFDFMRVMCLQYWPSGSSPVQYGDVEVQMVEQKAYAHFILRRFRLARVDKEGLGAPRLLTQFHFIEWELDSFPYISAFLELRRRVRRELAERPSPGPLIIHCSNGGARSATFAALDANLEMLEREGQADVLGFAKQLLWARPGTLESLDQYAFMYDCLVEWSRCKVAPIPLEQLAERAGLARNRRGRADQEAQDMLEYSLLCQLSPSVRIGDCAGGHRLENRGKNRDVMVVPPDNSRPYLQTLHGESKDYTYINAVYVDGFTRKAEWIVTEWPKPQTLDSLWALVFDHNAHTLVNLTSNPGNKAYPPLVHNKGKQVYGPFIVEVLSYHSYPSCTSHMVKVMKRTFMISEIMASGSNAIQEAETRICCILTARMWPLENKVPLSTSGLMDVIKMGRSWRARAPDRPETKPTIVLSHNGRSRVGIFIAANVCIQEMEMDQEVDVFHAVKMIRINRPQLVDTKDEYKYLHDLMLHWFLTQPEYAKYRTGGNAPSNLAINHQAG